MIDCSVVPHSADDSHDSSDHDPSPSPAVRSRISIQHGETTYCREITLHCNVKTLRLGTRFHQCKEDNSRLGRTVVLFLYLPESGQSRYLSLSSLVVIG